MTSERRSNRPRAEYINSCDEEEKYYATRILSRAGNYGGEGYRCNRGNGGTVYLAHHRKPVARYGSVIGAQSESRASRRRRAAVDAHGISALAGRRRHLLLSGRL